MARAGDRAVAAAVTASKRMSTSPDDRRARASRSDETPWSLLALLMAMTAIGPLALNIVVPTLPKLRAIFSADAHTVQLSVSLFLAGLAVAQLLVGPLADRFGRRPVALGGLMVTAAASLAALAVDSAGLFIAARVLQAFGAATGVVVGRAVIRDLFDRDRSAAMIGLVATAMVVAPMISPLVGGILDTAFGWQSCFLFIAAVAIAVLAWAATTLPETRDRHPPSPGGFLADARSLAGNLAFNGYVMCATFGSATFFAFLGGGPHVVITLMGRSSAEYGVWFAISALGYMSGNFVASRLSMRHGVERMILGGLVLETIGVTLSIALSYAHAFGPAVVFLPQIVTSFGNGVMLPGAIAGAISVRPQAAGTASGVLGCVQMAVGAAFVQLGGTVLMNAASPLPVALLMAASVAVFALAQVFMVPAAGTADEA
jgi:MFS transporter, DHA1 family, multidrug resistance protein